MSLLRVLLVVCLVSLSKISFSQKQAIVLRNVWNNNLTSYNPEPFFDNVLAAFAESLSVKKVVEEKGVLQTENADVNWDKKIKDQIKEKSASGNSTYYITMETELRLPTINVGRVFFKNPITNSKIIFSYHVYNSSGFEIIADTIVNRGCYAKAIEEKSSKTFYDSYKNFTDDMQCHADAIKKRMQEVSQKKFK